ncbi:DUF4129 domain-containing protein [Sandaracinobacteroides hominis]|uniref:DUF4129 domain-containing protein n=1 Tax=Sandaracinobacteroides hominis TaxID=2780086 RepID=UPI0018F5B593|nr:DUF4129 domain-containing protein [Sandaracinobacteroides hominis]
MAEGAGAEIGAEQQFAHAHAELLQSRSIQFELPPFQQPEVPDWLKWLGQALKVLEPFLPAIFWTIVGIGALILLYLIAAALLPGRLKLPGWFRRRPAPEAPHLLQPTEETARELLAEADALAGAGRYDEAAHTLLARTIEEMDKRLPGEVRPTLTSRELGGSALLPARPATHFRAIVALVERSLFARRSLNATDWADCRAAYASFAGAEGWTRGRSGPR